MESGIFLLLKQNGDEGVDGDQVGIFASLRTALLSNSFVGINCTKT